MKKLLTFVLAGVMLLSLTACGGKEHIVSLYIEDSGIYSACTLEAKGDTVHTFKQSTSMDCTGLTENQLAIMFEAAAPYEEIYNGIEGVTYKVEVVENKFKETLTIDVTNPDTIAALEEQNLSPVKGDGTVSLSDTITHLTEQGWTTVEEK